MRKVAAALVLVVFAVGALLWYAPWLTEQRTVVASTPSLDGISFRAEVKLPGGKTACIRPVPLDPNVREVQMLLDTRGSGAPAVDLTMTGPGGYRATGRFAGYAPRRRQRSWWRASARLRRGGGRPALPAQHRPPGHRPRRHGRARVRHRCR